MFELGHLYKKKNSNYSTHEKISFWKRSQILSRCGSPIKECFQTNRCKAQKNKFCNYQEK